MDEYGESCFSRTSFSAPMINWDTDGDRFAFVELLRDDDSLFRIEVTLDRARLLPLTGG